MSQIGQAIVRTAGLLMLATQLTACGAARGSDRSSELRTLLDAYREQSAQALQRQDSIRHTRLQDVAVTRTSAADVARVSVRLRDVPLAPVVARILEEAGQPFVLQNVALRGSATAVFSDQPMVTALNLLLRGGGYRAELEDGVVAIRNGVVQVSAADDVLMHVEVPISYLPQDGMDETLTRLFDGLDLRFAFMPHAGNIVLTGRRSPVEEAMALLRRADREPQHVLIEALVVEIDREGLERLGIDVASFASGKFSDVFTAFGSAAGAGAGFTRQSDVTNPNQLTVLLDALAVTDAAEVIARPYLSTRSGHEALVEIMQERTFQTSVQPGFFTSEPPVHRAGVQMKVTPWALPDEQVRLSIDVAESQFLPIAGNVIADVDQNRAVTTMQVQSGQTIVIGGLALKRESSSNSGVPVLRDIPLLNLLFSRRERSSRNQEVILFITPHIWDPSMDPPLVRGDLLRAPSPDRRMP